MRKGAFIFGLALAVAVSYGFATGRQTNRTGDVITATRESNDDVAVVYVTSSPAVAQNVVMVDLSDNVNFKHVANAGGIVISQIETDLLLDDTASATVKYGVMASSTPAGDIGTVRWFHTAYFNSRDGHNGRNVFSPYPASLKLAVAYTQGSVASSTYFVTNDATSNSTAFATTTAFSSPYAANSVNLAVGDLVMRIDSITGTVTKLTSRVIYHTEE